MKINFINKTYQKDFIDIFRIFSNEDLIYSTDAAWSLSDDELILDQSYRFKDRLELKQILYAYFSDYYKMTSPWGLMTGTKPMKLYRQIGPDGLKDKYQVSPQKILLLDTIDQTQKAYDYNNEDIHLYIHIPFCPSRCSYCSYPTIVYANKDRRQEFLDGLLYEIKEMAASINNYHLRSIYIGGGTPSALTHEQLETLLKSLSEEFNLHVLEEFTIEAGREDTLDIEKLKLFKHYQVSRISINPQTFNQDTLNKIARKQDNDRLISLYKTARELGFIVNMDLIIGLEDEKMSDVVKSLEEVGRLKPQNITIHTLSYKKGSKLVDQAESYQKTSDMLSKAVALSIHMAQSMGYQPYYLYRQKEILGNFENIGYSLPTYASIYNIASNEEHASIIGLGMNASSKIVKSNKIKRYTNYKNLNDYLEQIDHQIQKKQDMLK